MAIADRDMNNIKTTDPNKKRTNSQHKRRIYLSEKIVNNPRGLLRLNYKI
jgi:hypothetical protein